MPKETAEYYRARIAFLPEETRLEGFLEHRLWKEEQLRRSAPDDCDKWALTSHYFSHEENGYVFYNYFENEDEMMGYKAAVFNDPEIYHRWKRGKAEEKQIREYYWRQRNG